MLKIIKEQWDKNRDLLRAALEEGETFNECGYVDLVKLSFEKIFNTGINHDYLLNLKRITEIDNGDYQGTLLYVIPFDTYQPSEHDHLMTYVNYGSCSGCDTLQAIQCGHDRKLTEAQVKNFMALCKDILTNTVRPFNNGWRHEEMFDQVTMEE